MLAFSQVLDEEQINTDASNMEDSVSAPAARLIPNYREPVNQTSPTVVRADSGLKNGHKGGARDCKISVLINEMFLKFIYIISK